jgi:hypothetical protein
LSAESRQGRDRDRKLTTSTRGELLAEKLRAASNRAGERQIVRSQFDRAERFRLHGRKAKEYLLSNLEHGSDA